MSLRNVLSLCAALSTSYCLPAPGKGQAGEIRAVVTEHAAYRIAGAPSAVIHIPSHFQPRDKLDLVLFFHGWSGCASVLMSEGPTACKDRAQKRVGWGLGEKHEASQTNTILIIPQLAFLERTTDPGEFKTPGVPLAFVNELLQKHLSSSAGRKLSLDAVGSITLVAHSAGYAAALTFLKEPGLEKYIKNVVLLDALYSGAEDFAAWVASSTGSRKLVSLYTGKATTFRQNKRLYALLRQQEKLALEMDPASLADAVRADSAVIMRSTFAHGAIPSEQLTPLLQMLFQPR